MSRVAQITRIASLPYTTMTRGNAIHPSIRKTRNASLDSSVTLVCQLLQQLIDLQVALFIRRVSTCSAVFRDMMYAFV